MRPEQYLEAEWERIKNYIPDTKDRELMDGYVRFRSQAYADSFDRWSTALYVGVCTLVIGLIATGIISLGIIVRQREIEAPLKVEIKLKEEQLRKLSERCIDKIICECPTSE